MFLKAFKEKTNKKYLNKLLSEREVNVDTKKVYSLAVIINIDENSNYNLFKTLANKLHVHENRIKVVGYSKEVTNDLNAWDVCFNSKDFGWHGSISNAELQGFLDEDFDVLISYYLQDSLEMKLMTAKSKAHLKIGLLQTDIRLNDLIINTNLNEYEVFEMEVIKYLTTLNKIKK